MKPLYLTFGLALVVLLIIIGRETKPVRQLHEAMSTCRYQTENTIPTFNECISNQLEQNGDK